MVLRRSFFGFVALFLVAAVCIGLWRGILAWDTQVDLPDRPEAELGALGLLARWRIKAEPLERQFAKAVQAGDWNRAEKVARELTTVVPRYAEGFYKLATVLMMGDRAAESLAALEQAVELGFRDFRRLEQEETWNRVRTDAGFQQIVQRSRSRAPVDIGVTPTPADVNSGEARVEDTNTDYEPASGLLLPLFNDPAEVANDWRPANVAGGEALSQWLAAGTAAGNRGDFYDNRDDGHSKLPRADFPQLTFIEYGPEARALQLHWGPPQSIFHQRPLIGNASVASVGNDYWRSMPRASVSTLQSVAMLQAQFMANQIYVYPSHHDYLPGHNGEAGGHGDVYYTNTPFTIASLGSSGSDQPFLRALLYTLASFQPDVKKSLIERHALAPTLQMIFRASSRRVRTADDYFTGAAHPPVFRSENIDQEKMMRMAQEMVAAELPPIPVLRVLEDSPQPVKGRDIFEPLADERLFDAPQVIARIFRGTAERRRLVLSAEQSGDFNGRQLQWRWTVLCGHAGRIEIKPLNEQSSRVEISVPWHGRYPVEPGAKLETNRIDIGCFVGNGRYWSCPAFVTFYCPDNETREYDADGRILSVTYNSNYADPVLVVKKDWRDQYHYDSGQLTGWTRIRGESREEFAATGERIVSPANEGQPPVLQRVDYRVIQKGAWRVVEQVDAAQ